MNKEIEYFYCHKKGHFRSLCRKLGEDLKRKQDVNIVELDEDIDVVCVYVGSNMESSSHSFKWTVDSAAPIGVYPCHTPSLAPSLATKRGVKPAYVDSF